MQTFGTENKAEGIEEEVLCALSEADTFSFNSGCRNRSGVYGNQRIFWDSFLYPILWHREERRCITAGKNARRVCRTSQFYFPNSNRQFRMKAVESERERIHLTWPAKYCKFSRTPWKRWKRQTKVYSCSDEILSCQVSRSGTERIWVNPERLALQLNSIMKPWNKTTTFLWMDYKYCLKLTNFTF